MNVQKQSMVEFQLWVAGTLVPWSSLRVLDDDPAGHCTRPQLSQGEGIRDKLDKDAVLDGKSNLYAAAIKHGGLWCGQLMIELVSFGLRRMLKSLGRCCSVSATARAHQAWSPASRAKAFNFSRSPFIRICEFHGKLLLFGH